jgi:predicted metal-dependent hydrolase
MSHLLKIDALPGASGHLNSAAIRISVDGHRRESGEWGSNGSWWALQLPPSLIDYIIVHELVHLIGPHHGPEFWMQVERAMPDFAERQQRLNELGATTSSV